MSFALAYAFTKKWEGGYSNHPSDPGGETNLGVTKKVYLDWCNKKGITPKSMRDLKDQDVMPIYEEMYWQASGADKLNDPKLAICVFDAAVNTGGARARKWLELEKNWRQYNQHRLAHYKTIIQRNPKLKVFEKGWNNRMADLSRYVDSLL